MAFSKAFPKRSDKSVYPKWGEVSLSDDEERRVEQDCRLENIRLMKECLSDARNVLAQESLKGYETSLVEVAIALFEKRASHAVYWKENAAKEKFSGKEETDE